MKKNMIKKIMIKNLSEQVKSRVNQQWDNISLPKDQQLVSSVTRCL